MVIVHDGTEDRASASRGSGVGSQESAVRGAHLLEGWAGALGLRGEARAYWTRPGLRGWARAVERSRLEQRVARGVPLGYPRCCETPWATTKGAVLSQLRTARRATAGKPTCFRFIGFARVLARFLGGQRQNPPTYLATTGALAGCWRKPNGMTNSIGGASSSDRQSNAP